ncbi:TRAP transporter substrate-binding protein [Cypionkella sp.]|uniref:TRAP transporter substrate-binding protein n=1 Tax=Cypionkella sp. TaxID=2811411 RepID=UPI002ABB3AE7|nr:TRAP transporter substrate-binding protein [Cypionkella sp.]MDZ4393456.1 TRAP transporter substrate-binding protein [Cypionkella sp.]
MGHPVFEAHPIHDTAVRFKEAVERLSGGDITIQIFPARQLGDVKDLMEGVQFGTVDMTVNSTSAYSTIVPSADAFQIPGLIADYEGFVTMAKSPEAQAILDEFQAHNQVALGVYDGGQRHFMTMTKPVESLADMKGLKTRVAPNKMFVDAWTATGVNPTPMAYGEVYSALETGTLDAVEINLTSIESEKYYEIGKGVTLTGQYFWPSFLIVNKATFDSMTPEQQGFMRDAADEIVEPQIMAVKELDAKILKHLEELNIPVVTPSDAFKAELVTAFKPVVDQYVASDPLISSFVAKAATLKPASQ